MTEPAHYQYSPSSSSRWLACPASAHFVDTSEAGLAAQMGTLAHEVAACQLMGVSLPQWAAEELNELPQDERVELLDAVRVYLDYVNAQEPVGKFIEIKLRHPSIDHFGGTMDALLLVYPGDMIHVIDFKFGTWEVDAEWNTQLACYLVLARTVFPGAHRFRGTIVQPRKWGYARPDTWDWTVDDIDQFQAEVVAATESEDFSVGAHCRFCPALLYCEEARRHTETLMAVEFNNPTPEHLAQVLEWAPIFNELQSRAEGLSLELAKTGTEIPGHKVVRTSGRRSWASEDDAKRALVESGALSSQMFETKMKTPAQMEKVADRELVNSLTVMSEGGHKVVPVSDRRRQVFFGDEFDEA